MKILRSGPKPIIPQNGCYSYVPWSRQHPPAYTAGDIVPVVDGSGHVTVRIVGGMPDGTDWYGPAGYDLTLPGTGPLSGTYRLWCQGVGVYSLSRCGDDQGCHAGGPAFGLTIIVQPYCAIPAGLGWYAGPCGEGAEVLCGDNSEPTGAIMGLELGVWYEATPDFTDLGPETEPLPVGYADGKWAPGAAWASYQTCHYTGAGGDLCGGGCNAVLGSVYGRSMDSDPQSAANEATQSLLSQLGGGGAGTTVPFYNFEDSCNGPIAQGYFPPGATYAPTGTHNDGTTLYPVTGQGEPGWAASSHLYYGGSYPAAGPTMTPAAVSFRDIDICADNYNCWSQVVRQTPSAGGSFSPAPCCLEIELNGVKPGAEISVYGAEYGYPNANGAADPSGYLNRRLKYRRTQCVNAVYYPAAPSDSWAAQPHGALNPFPATFSLILQPMLVHLSRNTQTQTFTAPDSPNCTGNYRNTATVSYDEEIDIVGYIVEAVLSGSEMSLREPTHPAWSYGNTAAAPLAEANAVTFQAVLPGNSAKSDILAMIGEGFTRTDGGPQNCSDLNGLYVDPLSPVGESTPVTGDSQLPDPMGSCFPSDFANWYVYGPDANHTTNWWGDSLGDPANLAGYADTPPDPTTLPVGTLYQAMDKIWPVTIGYSCGLGGPPITIHDLDGTGTGGTTAWHMTPLPGPGACSDYRGTDYWSGPATATVHVPSISGDSLGTADADFWPCNNVEKNDPTKNVLGWQLAFTDLDGRAQELVFWPDSRDNGNSWSAALSPGWFPGHDTAGWPLPWRITRETTLQNREGATLLRIRTGHQKYTFDRGFVVPTSWYQDSAGGGGVAGNNPLDLCAGSPPPCQGAPLTNTIFGSLPVDPDDHCTAIDDNGACIAYDDPQTLAYRYLMLDEGFLPGSTITLTPICKTGDGSSTAYYADSESPSGWANIFSEPIAAPTGCSNAIPDPSTLPDGTEFDCETGCPEPAPAQCNQIDGVNLFNLPWGDVMLASLAGNRQPPFGLSNGPGGFDYLLARTADGPLGQANFTLTLTPHGGSSPSYSCTFTTGLVADCYYAGPIPLSLPGLQTPWLEWYYARDCDAVQWQVTFDGTTADGHNWGTGADAPGGTDVVQPLPLIGGNGLPAGLVADPHNPGLPLFNTPTAPSWWHGTSAPEIDGHARRIDIVRTASGAYLLTVSDYYPGSGSAADPSRWNHLWTVLGAGCCSNSYTGVAMLTFNPANPTPYPFASCGAASGVTVTAVPQLCHEQCAATTWTVTRGPLTWTLSGSAGGPWSDTVSAGVQAEAVQQGTTTKYTIAWRWTDGTHYLTWSATADSSVSGPQTVTLAGSDTLTWPVTISYAAGTWTLTFPWPGGPYSFSFSGTGWQTLGSLALMLTQNADAGGHGWYTLSIVVAGGLTLGRKFADQFDDVRNCQAAFGAGVPLELSDSAGNDYGLVTATALT